MIDLSPVPTVYEHFRTGTAASEDEGRPPPTQKKLVVTEAFFPYTTMEQLAGSERSTGLVDPARNYNQAKPHWLEGSKERPADVKADAMLQDRHKGLDAMLKARPKIYVNILSADALRSALSFTRLPKHTAEAIISSRPFAGIDDLRERVSCVLTAVGHSPMGPRMARELSLQLDFAGH